MAAYVRRQQQFNQCPDKDSVAHFQLTDCLFGLFLIHSAMCMWRPPAIRHANKCHCMQGIGICWVEQADCSLFIWLMFWCLWFPSISSFTSGMMNFVFIIWYEQCQCWIRQFQRTIARIPFFHKENVVMVKAAGKSSFYS